METLFGTRGGDVALASLVGWDEDLCLRKAASSSTGSGTERRDRLQCEMVHSTNLDKVLLFPKYLSVGYLHI